MAKQNVLKELAIFCHDLPKAAGICFVCMAFGIFAFAYTGRHIATVLAGAQAASNVQPGMILIVELIAFWFLAFAMGVKARPVRTQEYLEYPPMRMMRGFWAHGVILFFATAGVFGYLAGVGLIASFLAALLGMLTNAIVVGSLLALWIPTTEAGVVRKKDPTVRIADSYHRSWWFSAAAVGGLCLLFQWMARENPISNFYIVWLHTSLIAAVFLTGFASGYYP